jgi:hypothetical protein
VTEETFREIPMHQNLRSQKSARPPGKFSGVGLGIELLKTGPDIDSDPDADVFPKESQAGIERSLKSVIFNL